MWSNGMEPKGNAIVVDDEPITRMDIAGMLEEAGYRVVAQGGDGFDAIELCRQHTPELLLLDIKMPTFDGLSAAITIQKEGTAGCIVLLTAFHDPEFIEKAKQAGVSGYLLKPVDERTLLSTVEISMAQAIRYRVAKRDTERIRQKLEERTTIDRARAIVSERDGVGESDAYAQMRQMAMDKRLGLYQVARMIVDSVEDKDTVARAKQLLMSRHHLNESTAFRRIRERAGRDGITETMAAERLLQEEGR